MDRVTLDVGETEFLTLVGPSGCGKSTLMRLIAGLEDPTSGDVYITDRRVNDIPIRARNVGFISQGHALFKHMTVAQNISFGLKIKKVPKAERLQRVEELVALMGLEGLESRRPDQLSGGQQQRVALARALARRPRVLLLDEPFGAVDTKVRKRLRADIKRWQRALKIPTILVTRDQREALELGDRVAVMNEGHIEQLDGPQTVCDVPATEFVARFIGRVNDSTTELGENNGRLVEGSRIETILGQEGISVHPTESPEWIGNGHISGTVVSYTFLGRTVRLQVRLKDDRLITVAVPKHQALSNRLDPGRSVALSLESSRGLPRNGNNVGPQTDK